jgi:hypothetical protein
MSQTEQRQTERLLLTIPIRVIGFETAAGQFSEDTHTIVVNRAGARIALKHRVTPEDTLRIINLENYSEADFRVVGPTRLEGAAVTEWGVECLDEGRNIWGIDLPPPLPHEGREAGVLLECRVCRTRAFRPVSLMEIEVLDSTGIIRHSCSQCGKPTHWTHADVTRRPRGLSPPASAFSPPPPVARKEEAEKRTSRRLGMKMPILVKARWGEQESAKTENVSKGGVAVSLAIELAVGDILTIVCPYTPGAQNIEQKAEVRRRATYSFGGKRLYGLRYVS